MSEGGKFLFDDCIGQPVMHAISAVLATGENPPTLKHIVEFQREGVTDQIWIPRIALEGWIIITPDRGKSNRGGKLPRLCIQH